MLRQGAPFALRSASTSLAPARHIGGRRFASSGPRLGAQSWRSSALRWGLAVAGIYYYNTSPVFAEQPQSNLLNPNLDAIDEQNNDTIESLTSQRKRPSNKNAEAIRSAVDAASSENASTSISGEQTASIDTPGPASPLELEEQADSEGAFNPVTGEINWDCPCLGGMAHGPCGPEFREAFSCFVYSTEEPKGMDCIEKFQNMQTCFRAHPDVYKGELEDDEELDGELEQERQQLVGEIDERRKAEKERQDAAAPQDRILEEPSSRTEAPGLADAATKISSRPQTTENTTALTQKSAAKESKQPPTSRNPPPAASSDKKPQPEAKTPTGAPPQMSMEHEQDHASKSQLTSYHGAPMNKDAGSESDLVPKAAHDARDAKSSPKETPK